MKLIDISWPIEHGTTTEYKDRNTLVIELRARIEKDDREESVICMGTHTGTHIDAPAHFIKRGKTIDQFPLDTFVGECLVVDCSSVEEMIMKDDLPSEIQTGTIVLLKTSNSLLSATGPFYPEFVYLSVEAADHLVSSKVKAVGIDYLSIERNQPGHPTHKALLSHNIPIIEGLRLAEVQRGIYYLTCFPLKFIRTEAAPARAVLRYTKCCSIHNYF